MRTLYFLPLYYPRTVNHLNSYLKVLHGRIQELEQTCMNAGVIIPGLSPLNPHINDLLVVSAEASLLRPLYNKLLIDILFISLNPIGNLLLLFILFIVRCGSLMGPYRLYLLLQGKSSRAYLEAKTLQV